MSDVPLIGVVLSAAPYFGIDGGEATLGQTIRLRARFFDTTTQAPLDPADPSITVTPPASIAVPQPQQIEFQGEALLRLGVGLYRADVAASTSGIWSGVARCTAPRPAAGRTQFAVAPLAGDRPGLPGPGIVTTEEYPVLTQSGGVLTAQRVTGLPPLPAGAGMLATDVLVHAVQADVDYQASLAAVAAALNARNGRAWSFYRAGQPLANEEVAAIALDRAVIFPQALAGSMAVARVAATAACSFSVTLNGAVFGSIAFAAGSAIGIFAAGTQTAAEAGDRLAVLAPAVPDATLADLTVNLLGFPGSVPDLVALLAASQTATPSATTVLAGLGSPDGAAALYPAPAVLSFFNRRNGIFNLRTDFGAAGDYVPGVGGTDDSAAIYNAIEACQGRSSDHHAQAMLFVPAGDYLGQVNITAPLRLIGAGRSAVRFQAPLGVAGPACKIQIGAPTYDYRADDYPDGIVEIDGVSFAGSGKADTARGTSGHGLLIAGTTYYVGVFLRNITFNKHFGGGFVITTPLCYGETFSVEAHGNHGTGVQMINAQDWIHHGLTSGVNDLGNCFCEAAQEIRVNGFDFFSSTGGHGLQISDDGTEGGDNIFFSDGSIDRNAVNGLLWDHAGYGAAVFRNVYFGQNAYYGGANSFGDVSVTARAGGLLLDNPQFFVPGTTTYSWVNRNIQFATGASGRIRLRNPHFRDAAAGVDRNHLYTGVTNRTDLLLVDYTDANQYPTSATGLASGQIWRNGSALNIA